MFPRVFAFLLAVCACLNAPARAQTPDAAAMQDFPVARLQALDKGTARTLTFEARVGATMKYGPLYIKVQACRKTPPVAQPESAAFVQVWEVTPKDEAQWVFSGWMFASSPALSAMDHPIYDIWVLDCLEQVTPAAKAPATAPAASTEKRLDEVTESTGD